MGEHDRLGLVIFDCDGVLVDSERIANRVWAELLTAAGLPTTVEESVATYLGRSMEGSLRIAEERLGRAVPAGLADRYYERVLAAYDDGLAVIPGVVAALDRIEGAGVEACVASSASPAKLGRALERAGLAGRFAGRAFSAAEVGRGKPAPDLFALAAARSGWAPERCVVVEDSPAGVAAAVAAGMHPLGFADLVPPERLAEEGAAVFSDMADLPGLVVRALQPA